MFFWNWVSIVLLIFMSLDTKVEGKSCYPNESFLRNEMSHVYYYDGHKYYASKNSFVNDVDSEEKCKSICGTLAMMEYVDELGSLIRLIKYLKTSECFLIRGNNKGQKDSNHFVIGDGPDPIPYINWADGYPIGGHGKQRCLFLADGFQGMIHKPCTNGPWECHFFCEVF